MKLNNIRYTDEDINNLDDYFSKEIEEYKEIEKSLIKEIDKQKEVLDKIKEYVKENMSYNTGTKIMYIPAGEDILELLEEIDV